MLPLSSLIIGLAGSTHCISMCGGISLACSKNQKENGTYQIGRLIGYFFLGIIANFLGSLFSISFFGKEIAILSAVLIGGTLVFLGLKNCIPLKAFSKFQLPIFFNTLVIKLWRELLGKKDKSPIIVFSLGFISILLPCGLLYGVILPLAALNSYSLSLLCVFTFWIGTLPIMSIAPNLIKKILTPLQKKVPLITSIILITLGLSTIGFRVTKILNSSDKTIQSDDSCR